MSLVVLWLSWRAREEQGGGIPWFVHLLALGLTVNENFNPVVSQWGGSVPLLVFHTLRGTWRKAEESSLLYLLTQHCSHSRTASWGGREKNVESYGHV